MCSGPGLWRGIGTVGNTLYAVDASTRTVYRVDPTTGAKAAITLTYQLVPAWSELVSDITYWYLRDRLGWPGDIVNIPAWAAARNYDRSRVTVALPDGYEDFADPGTSPPTATYRRGTANGIIKSGDEPSAVRRELGFAAGGGFYELGGVYYFMSAPPGIDRPKEFTITLDDVPNSGTCEPPRQFRTR